MKDSEPVRIDGEQSDSSNYVTADVSRGASNIPGIEWRELTFAATTLFQLL